MAPKTGSYYLANSLIGFRKNSLRVRVLANHIDGSVSVVTADLLDAGTTLLLNGWQLSDINEEVR